LSDTSPWKTGLLASGLPLESEVAALLVGAGFRVDTDFKFRRPEGEATGESSVPLRARAAAPLSDPERAAASVDLLFECRHRDPQTAWLFLPEVNEPSRSPVVKGNTIRVVDKFSPYAMDPSATAGFDVQMPICRKGLEIEAGHGNVCRREPDGGLEQLQYVLPRLLIEAISSHLGGPPGKNAPFMFCPILLTTARLLVADKGMSAESVERAVGLEELAEEVPCLIAHRDFGPDFASFCRQEFRVLEGLESHDGTLIVERKRAGHFRSDAELPVAIIESLIAGRPEWLQRFFTQFVVCTASKLPALIESIRRAVDAAVETRKGLP